MAVASLGVGLIARSVRFSCLCWWFCVHCLISERDVSQKRFIVACGWLTKYGWISSYSRFRLACLGLVWSYKPPTGYEFGFWFQFHVLLCWLACHTRGRMADRSVVSLAVRDLCSFPPSDKYVITFVLINGGSFSSSQFAYDATGTALIVSWLVS